MSNRKSGSRKIRYAVVGQGHIAQVAVLPAFKHARDNSELAALVSDDPVKLRSLGKKYGVSRLCRYDEYTELLSSGEIDAVYIALPNFLHHDFAVEAARAGVHVLCEKPLETSPQRAVEMIRAARYGGVKLMTAYRLHFEETNLLAADLLRQKNRIGEPKIFNSVFTIAVDEKNYRAGPRSEGGGPIFDIGIYCINAARMLFRDEPIEAMAMDLRSDPQKFGQSEETMSVSLRFPGDRVANFVCSFGAYPVGQFSVVGAKGVLSVENAYEYVGDKILEVRSSDSRRNLKKTFKSRDQFAPELLYFSDCILKNREPEPSGIEGLADLVVIQAVIDSAESGQSQPIEPVSKDGYPTLRQQIRIAPVREPRLVRVKEPSKDEAA